jgi:hypothetical protein
MPGVVSFSGLRRGAVHPFYLLVYKLHVMGIAL